METPGPGEERCCCLSGAEGSLGGHQSLSCLSIPLPALPQAAILQQTAEYIFSLEQEKTRLLQQNTQLKRFIQVAPACALQGREGDGTGQSQLAGDGMSSLFLGVRARSSVLISRGWRCFTPSWQGRGAWLNLACPTWQGEKGWGPIFHLG